jgi:hypothetical protein
LGFEEGQIEPFGAPREALGRRFGRGAERTQILH